MECIVLAGGVPSPRDSLAPHAAGRPKALIEIAGRPMIAWVLDALLGSRHIERVVVVGLESAAIADRPPSVEVLPDHGGMVANFYAGLGRLAGSGTAAFCWADIPLVRAPMIDRFIETTPDPERDITQGFVLRTVIQARYPDADDLWIRLREGQVIATDFGLFHPRHTARVRPLLEALDPLRKSAARGALQLGLRCGVRLVDDPELGLDVDTAHDLELCRRALGARTGHA